jgi:hypothetical protein
MIYFDSQVINNLYMYYLNQLYIEFVEYNKEKYETQNILIHLQMNKFNFLLFFISIRHIGIINITKKIL